MCAGRHAVMDGVMPKVLGGMKNVVSTHLVCNTCLMYNTCSKQGGGCRFLGKRAESLKYDLGTCAGELHR
eukprot:12003238-Alexandrium_andersonii.AAC.1